MDPKAKEMNGVSLHTNIASKGKGWNTQVGPGLTLNFHFTNGTVNVRAESREES